MTIGFVWYFALVVVALRLGADNCLLAAENPSAEGAESQWDPERYIGVDELERGMTGYGLTVFAGSRIERFKVEVVSVVRNFEPKRDAIIIRCIDERFRLAKMVRGVSGSPVYFKDRLAGAMAFGWPFSEEPLYGVTPIRQMLTVRRTGGRPIRLVPGEVEESERIRPDDAEQSEKIRQGSSEQDEMIRRGDGGPSRGVLGDAEQTELIRQGAHEQSERAQKSDSEQAGKIRQGAHEQYEQIRKGDTEEFERVRRRGRATFGRDMYKDLMGDDLLSREEVQRLAQQAGLAWSSGPDIPSGSGMTAEFSGGAATLPVAMSVGGFSGRALEVLREEIPGLIFQAHLGGSGSKPPLGADSLSPGGEETSSVEQGGGERIKLEPGSVLSVPLIMGDMSGQVMGTVTEVVGNEVYGFGHSWSGEGAAAWPMGTGYIHTFVNLQNASFKLGESVEIVGAIQADEAPAVYGVIGGECALVPMRVEVSWYDRAEPEVFEVKLAQDERRDAILVVSVALNSLMQRGGLPREHTLEYEVELEFDQLAPIRFSNISSSNSVADIFGDIMDALALVLLNPWQEVKLTGAVLRARVADEESVWTIKSGQLGRLRYEPGETVRARVRLDPTRGAEEVVEISMRLPADLAEGKYKITLGSVNEHRRQLQLAQPYRFLVFDAEDVRDVLQERLSLRRDRLYMQMMGKEQGVALEDEALPDLPSSKAMLLTDKSRNKVTTRFRPLISAQAQTAGVVVGGMSFDIEVKKRD